MKNTLTKLANEAIAKQKEIEDAETLRKQIEWNIKRLEWKTEREIQAPTEISKLESILLQLAQEGKREYILDLNWMWQDDPVIDAIIDYLKTKNIDYKIDSYPVYELDYDMCQTNRFSHNSWHLIIKW